MERTTRSRLTILGELIRLSHRCARSWCSYCIRRCGRLQIDQRFVERLRNTLSLTVIDGVDDCFGCRSFVNILKGINV